MIDRLILGKYKCVSNIGFGWDIAQNNLKYFERSDYKFSMQTSLQCSLLLVYIYSLCIFLTLHVCLDNCHVHVLAL